MKGEKPPVKHLRLKKGICAVSLFLSIGLFMASVIAYNDELHGRPLVAEMIFTHSPDEQVVQCFLSPRDNLIRIIVHSIYSVSQTTDEDDLLKVSLFKNQNLLFSKTMKPMEGRGAGHTIDMADYRRRSVAYSDYGDIEIEAEDRYTFKIRPEGNVSNFEMYHVYITRNNATGREAWLKVWSVVFFLIGAYFARYVKITFR